MRAISVSQPLRLDCFFTLKKSGQFSLAPVVFTDGLWGNYSHDCGCFTVDAQLRTGFYSTSYRVELEATLIALTSVSVGAAVFLFVIMKSRIMAEKEWFLLPFGKRLATLQLRLTKRKGE